MGNDYQINSMKNLYYQQDGKYIVPTKINIPNNPDQNKKISNIFGVKDPSILARSYWANQNKQNISSKSINKTNNQKISIKNYACSKSLYKVSSQSTINGVNNENKSTYQRKIPNNNKYNRIQIQKKDRLMRLNSCLNYQCDPQQIFGVQSKQAKKISYCPTNQQQNSQPNNNQQSQDTLQNINPTQLPPSLLQIETHHLNLGNDDQRYLCQSTFTKNFVENQEKYAKDFGTQMFYDESRKDNKQFIFLKKQQSVQKSPIRNLSLSSSVLNIKADPQIKQNLKTNPQIKQTLKTNPQIKQTLKTNKTSNLNCIILSNNQSSIFQQNHHSKHTQQKILDSMSQQQFFLSPKSIISQKILMQNVQYKNLQIFDTKSAHLSLKSKPFNKQNSNLNKRSFQKGSQNQIPYLKVTVSQQQQKNSSAQPQLLNKIHDLQQQIWVLKQKQQQSKFQSRRYSPIKKQRIKKSQRINDCGIDNQEDRFNDIKTSSSKHRSQYFKLKLV